ncbi:hypothetical protein [Bosea sp. 117]|uniref:hypothetical protein n=1 Tax=Bosea sp. 117 TaxID=1125973 RepID=UPI00068C193C|nr:hypothetical protein [Bosea sp. 117]
MKRVSSKLTLAAGAFALAAAFSVGAGSAPAHAGAAMPALGSAVQPAPLTEEVRWICGPYRCAWRPNYRGVYVVPGYARYWGPPRRPGCYWTRGPAGRWVQVC